MAARSKHWWSPQMLEEGLRMGVNALVQCLVELVLEWGYKLCMYLWRRLRRRPALGYADGARHWTCFRAPRLVLPGRLGKGPARRTYRWRMLAGLSTRLS